MYSYSMIYAAAKHLMWKMTRHRRHLFLKIKKIIWKMARHRQHLILEMATIISGNDTTPAPFNFQKKSKYNINTNS